MDTAAILESIGYTGIFISVFIECGVPLGLILPLPGYTMLFTAGVFAAGGHLNFWVIIIIGMLAAVLGYMVGYLTGYRYGRKLFFERKNKKYFTPEQGRKTERFMRRFGYSTLIIGRFIAFVHNLAPILSGIAKTPFGYFMIANVVGAILWVSSAVLLGYYLGQTVPNAQTYVIPVVLSILIFLYSPYGRRLIKKVVGKIEDL
jgi:membrane-associated protein